MSDQSADVSRRAFLRAGAGATAVAAGAGTAAGQEEGGGGGGGSAKPKWPSYVSGAKGGAYKDLRGESEVTVEVGAGDGLAFMPTKIWIDPGTKVTYKWVSSGHDVLPKTKPDGAEWEGHQPIESSGFTYSHTFETGGMYTYYCQPHESLGMKGAVAVGGDVETEQVGGGGGGGGRPEVPDAAKSLGIATGFGMAATLGLAYFFLKYGGDYGEYDEA
ncbi:MAG: plastocyanin/azurin family copper-binding protein [Halosimplex sp.]